MNDARTTYNQARVSNRNDISEEKQEAWSTYRSSVNDARDTYRQELKQAIDELEEAVGDLSSISVTLEFD